MTCKGMVANHLAGAGLLEPLRRTFMCLQLGDTEFVLGRRTGEIEIITLPPGNLSVRSRREIAQLAHLCQQPLRDPVHLLFRVPAAQSEAEGTVRLVIR
jgi:hypothetical protein